MGCVCVVFLLLLFFAVFFAVLVRPFLCVYWCCCLVVFVFGLDKFKFLVVHFLSVVFCATGFFLWQILCVAILLCCCVHFVCCVVSAGSVFLLLFSVRYGCVWHCIYNALVRCPLAALFLLSPPPFLPPYLAVLFLLLLPPPAIRAKHKSSVPIWALPCPLIVPPCSKLPHCTHTHHPRASTTFRSCVSAFCCECT